MYNIVTITAVSYYVAIYINVISYSSIKSSINYVYKLVTSLTTTILHHHHHDLR